MSVQYVGISSPSPTTAGSSRSLAHEAGTSWLAGHSRRLRLRRYAAAMGWDFTTSGVMVGDVDGIAVRAYEDRTHATVLELVAPGVLPRMEMVHADTHVAQVSDGMRDVHLGDPVFERTYVIRAADPWMARAVVDCSVRRALVAAPKQTWATKEDRLISRSNVRCEPLDLFARATALRRGRCAVGGLCRPPHAPDARAGADRGVRAADAPDRGPAVDASTRLSGRRTP